jgi:hypothetical protein
MLKTSEVTAKIKMPFALHELVTQDYENMLFEYRCMKSARIIFTNSSKIN